MVKQSPIYLSRLISASDVTSLALAKNSSQLYYIDRDDDDIRVIDLNETNAKSKLVIHRTSYNNLLRTLAVSGGYLFWTERTFNAVWDWYSWRLYAGRIKNGVVTRNSTWQMEYMTGWTVLQTVLQLFYRKQHHPTDHSPCSHKVCQLQHHPTKTKLMYIGSKYNTDTMTYDIPVMMNNQFITLAHSYTCLGVKLDEKLNWHEHVEMICKKIGAGIGAMQRIKPYVPINTLHTIYRALIEPYFDYCSPLWDVCNQQLKDKLQKFQNRAARIITGASYDIRSDDVLRSLAWENLETRRRITKSILMYKILNDCAGPNLKDALTRRDLVQTSYNLRNTYTDLTLAKPKREFLKKSFKYSGAKLWNSLPSVAKLAQSIYSFKNCLKDSC